MFRTSRSPDFELGGMLASIERRLAAQEVRAQWAGSVQQSAVEVNSIFGTMNDMFVPVVYDEVTYLDLPAGRWVLFGQATQQLNQIDVEDVLGQYLYMKVSWESGALTDERIAYRYSVTPLFGYFRASNVTALAVTSSAPSRAALSVAAAASPPASFTQYLYSVNLIAFPG